MSIWVDEEQKIFHLQSKDTSYIMRVVKGRYLAHVYWGKKIHTPDVDCLLYTSPSPRDCS